MIHVLQISPDLTIKDLKKLARRYAMTGGYEVELSPDLSAEDLKKLAEMHIPELCNYKKGTSVYRTNNSYRILEKIFANPLISPELREIIGQNLAGIIHQTS